MGWQDKWYGFRWLVECMWWGIRQDIRRMALKRRFRALLWTIRRLWVEVAGVSLLLLIIATHRGARHALFPPVVQVQGTALLHGEPVGVGVPQRWAHDPPPNAGRLNKVGFNLSTWAVTSLRGRQSVDRSCSWSILTDPLSVASSPVTGAAHTSRHRHV